MWQLLDAQSKKDDCKVGSRRCFCGSFAEIGCVEKFSTFSLFKLSGRKNSFPTNLQKLNGRWYFWKRILQSFETNRLFNLNFGTLPTNQPTNQLLVYYQPTCKLLVFLRPTWTLKTKHRDLPDPLIFEAKPLRGVGPRDTKILWISSLKFCLKIYVIWNYTMLHCGRWRA